MSYDLLPRAERELQEILRTRAEVAGVASAQKLDERFNRVMDLIGEMGAPGAIRTDLLNDPRYRFVPVDPYWLIWRDTDTPNLRLIVKIIDARREVAEILKGFSE